MKAAIEAIMEVSARYRWRNVRIGLSFSTACTEAMHQKVRKRAGE